MIPHLAVKFEKSFFMRKKKEKLMNVIDYCTSANIYFWPITSVMT